MDVRQQAGDGGKVGGRNSQGEEAAEKVKEKQITHTTFVIPSASRGIYLR